MLDFLFELGQLLSLLGLVSGCILTIRYRKWLGEAHPTQPQFTEINLLASRSDRDELASSLTAHDAKPEHIDRVAA